jgi:hypothetical protein
MLEIRKITPGFLAVKGSSQGVEDRKSEPGVGPVRLIEAVKAKPALSAFAVEHITDQERP